MVLPN
jgi:hypothetical protein